MTGFLWSAIDAVIKHGLSISIAIRTRWTGYNVGNYTFFKESEIKGLDKELVAMLDWARGRAGVPFVITCGLRTTAQNAESGGVKDSSHLKGLAVDIACTDSVMRFKMTQSLLLAGFKRLGIYDRHVHADRDPSLPEEVMWIGLSH